VFDEEAIQLLSKANRSMGILEDVSMQATE
jgi:hypothetical protein